MITAEPRRIDIQGESLIRASTPSGHLFVPVRVYNPQIDSFPVSWNAGHPSLVASGLTL
jgi:hypothetical protein